MHLIELRPGTPLKLPAGKYLAENINTGEFMAREWCIAWCPDGVEYKPFGPSQDWNGKSVLFVRPGGYGDLLFLTPCFAEIKRRWPGVKIKVACFDHYFDIYGDNPDVDGLISYPVSVDAWNTFDAQVWLENSIEIGPEGRTKHVVDLYAERLGLEIEDKRMKYFITMDERLTAFNDFPRQLTMFGTKKKPRVGIQISASGPSRTYPHTKDVAVALWKAGWEVFMFGFPGEVETDSPSGVVNFTKLRGSGATFRESCAALATCDVCVAPDSALCHVAGALGVPTVALYGPFPWKLRTTYAPKTFALNGNGACAPCFWHQRGGQLFPPHGPCAKTGRCEVLAGIDPDRVVAEVEKRRPAEVEDSPKLITA
jgi:ADP-heptose:LPS heptosyltransferase